MEKNKCSACAAPIGRPNMKSSEIQKGESQKRVCSKHADHFWHDKINVHVSAAIVANIVKELRKEIEGLEADR